MRLATIDIDGRPTAAAIVGDGAAVPLAAGSLAELIASGPAGLAAARRAAEAGSGRIPADRVRLLAPLPRPAKNVFCVGRNYAEHIAEGERAQNVKIGVTEVPVFFTKPPTAVIGPGAAVPLFPHLSTQIDYEVELAVVIGTAGRDIPPERALAHVFGYTIVNDITARDVQRRHGGQYFKGKGLDGSCPMGPWIVTADEIPDPAGLGDPQPRQWRAPAGLDHRGDDLRHPDADRLAVGGPDARAGRRARHGHALGRRLCHGPAALPRGRRRRRLRDRGNRRPGKPGAGGRAGAPAGVTSAGTSRPAATDNKPT